MYDKIRVVGAVAATLWLVFSINGNHVAQGTNNLKYGYSFDDNARRNFRTAANVTKISPAADDGRDAICGFFFEIPKGDWNDNNVPGPEDFIGTTWAERPLIPAPHRDELCMGVYNAGLRQQSIFMEEEIQEEVIIARLNYNGNASPVVINFVIGSPIMLDVQIRRIEEQENYWFIIVNGRQDYETLNPTMYVFDVAIPEETLRATVHLVITNIDDNPPILHIFDNCMTEELGDPRPTDCEYQVTDADGEISTRFMEFHIESDRGDENIFVILSEYNEADWFTMKITIQIKEPLNFETSAFHIFRIVARDSFPNEQSAMLMVEVINIPHRPPRWVEIWSIQRFPENTAQSFTVRALDGDTGINQPIFYSLNNTNNYPFFSIDTLENGRGGGIFHVEPIDRDELEQEVFQLGIVAYKEDDITSYTEMPVVIIVDDVNNNMPLPFYEVYNITIPEETPMTLNFDQEFGFHDRDLGPNAQYNVRLESVSPPGAAEAFYIAPQSGYQRQTFFMGTLLHNMLDYENEPFQHIILKVIATEMFYPDHYGEALIHIYLENWNDELPIFEEAVVDVTFNETVEAGFPVGTVLATDRDINDHVTHSLLGNAADFLTIDVETGEVTVAINDAFDYHRQNELFIQVQAQDNFPPQVHTATAQLIIRLIDINNTPPSLRLPRRSPEVKENIPEGTIITEEITASDPDTSAVLRFEIDWDSSFAVKQGRDAPRTEFVKCVEIVTEYPTIGNTRSAVGIIKVLELEGRPGVTIDFEEFEILYLMVRVVDEETVYGEPYDELILAINIIDMNDNAPEWDQSTLDTEFRVRETSASNFVIGTIHATDIDGPLYNQDHIALNISTWVVFIGSQKNQMTEVKKQADAICCILSLLYPGVNPREDTPQDLVKVDAVTGQLSVDKNEAIDADVPPRHYLYYTVVASDECSLPDTADCPPDPEFWETEGEISIMIMDRNNRIPTPDFEYREVEIYEDVEEGFEVVTILADDLDRDEVHHTLNYQIQFLANNRLRDFFQINSTTGQVYVHYPGNDVLDRDRGEETHHMFFIIVDNFNFEGDGNRNSVTDVEVLVILLDVNDNAPEMPSPSELFWSVNENFEEGRRLVPDIFAPDIDQPDHDNSRVGYRIKSLTIKDRTIEVPDLFMMVNIDNKTGELETLMPLRGYWGTYDIWIEAYDHGEPQQKSNETYELVIIPYNFNAPQFVFPVDGNTVRLARERAVVNMPLILVNGDTLNTIKATDDDGLEAGIVDYEVFGDEEAKTYFLVSGDGTLTITQPIDALQKFQITIRAQDRGTIPGPKHSDSTFTVLFVPILTEPRFEEDTYTVAIMEHEAGLDERHQLPRAVDDKNFGCIESVDCREVYYHIIDGNDEVLFSLETKTNVLYLLEMLDRNVTTEHELSIAATNSEQPPSSTPDSVLTVTVNVREANPRPRFVEDLYTFGISADDQVDRFLFTIRATHTEDLHITYKIIEDSMEVNDPSLNTVAGTAFRLNEETGEIFLNHQPNINMHGMFQFKVEASDGVATDEADVKIFLISERNRVTFIFINSLEDIQESRDFIGQTFTVGFKMTCNIDAILPATEADGSIREDRTEVRSHFIQDNVPVPAELIEDMRSDTQLLRSIQNTLSTQLLNLEDFVTSLTPDTETDVNQIMVIILAGLAIVLVLMFVFLLILFFIKTRGLNRRLEALSTTKFGSMESNLNRAGATVPGTNKHAIEGSNPVWNEQVKAPDFDALSDDSGDEDLIGIEDMPQFMYEDNANEDATRDAVDSINPRVADHSNNFGFNATTPFSAQFGRNMNNIFY